MAVVHTLSNSKKSFYCASNRQNCLGTRYWTKYSCRGRDSWNYRSSVKIHAGQWNFVTSHLLETQHTIPWQSNQTSRNLAKVTGGKAFAFSSWWYCCSKAVRRAGGVTPLTLGDFHHADVRAAGHKFGMALRLCRRSSSTEWGWTSVHELGTSSTATATPVQGAASAWGHWNLYELRRAGRWKAQNYPIWEATIYNDWIRFIFSAILWFHGMNDSLTTAKIMPLFKLKPCNNLYKHC